MKLHRLINADKLGELILLVILLISAIQVMASWVEALHYPYALDFGEGPLLNQAMLFNSGKIVYQLNLTEYPYILGNYPPLYTALIGLMSNIFGLNLPLGRSVTCISALLAVIFLALVIFSISKDKFASAIGSLLMFTAPFFSYWSALFRVDLMALMFSLAGILVAVRWQRTWWSPLISAFFLIAAIFTRNTFVLAAPLAVTGWYFISERKKAVIFLAILGVGVLAAFEILNLWTNGGFFTHTIAGNANRYSTRQTFEFSLRFFYTVPLLLALVIVELTTRLRTRHSSYLLLIIGYLIGSFSSALLVGKIGAGENYFIELLASFCLFTGLVVARRRGFSHPSRNRVILMILLSLQALWLMNFTRFYINNIDALIKQKPEMDELALIVSNEPAPVLADEHTELIVLANKELLLQTFEFTQLAIQGDWDQGQVVKYIYNRRFGLILINDQPPFFNKTIAQNRWTTEMWSAIQTAYQPGEILASTTVFRPRK